MDELEVPCMYEDYYKLCPGAPGRLLRHALWHNLRRRCGLLDKQLFYAAAGSKIDSIMLEYLRDLCAAAEPQIPLYICRLRQADVASGVMAFEYRYSRDHIVGLINKRKQNFLQAGRAAIAASRQLCTIKQRSHASTPPTPRATAPQEIWTGTTFFVLVLAGQVGRLEAAKFLLAV
ncbi:hypothetical protein U9M48_015862 [Paspalum notatum var. saurae]|uniref:Uncharacterized protein n=1 Tax=Paspalum notatum var. saurae TaxID=547442 RepID=A0AAQ3WLW8_PASNO